MRNDLEAKLRKILEPLVNKATEVKPATHINTFRDRLAIIAMGAFIGSFVMIMFKTPAKDTKDIIVYMVGQISGIALTVMTYYFGRSQGEDKRQADSNAIQQKQVDALKGANENLAAATGINQQVDQVADAAVEKAEEIKSS